MNSKLDNLFKTQVIKLDKLTRDIIDFNLLIGNNYKDPDLKDGLISTYKELFTEEFTREYCKAETPIQFLDALCDMWVVGSFLYKCTTSEDYQGNLYNGNVWYENSIDYMKDSIYIQDHMSILDDIIYSTSGTLDFEGALEEVNRSNLTKVPLVKDFIEAMTRMSSQFYAGHYHLEKAAAVQIELIEEEGRYGDITYKVVTDKGGLERIAFFAGRDVKDNITYDRPKLVKPCTFEDPELEWFIREDLL